MVEFSTCYGQGVMPAGFDPSEWELVSNVRDPWGQIPFTDGGRFLPERARQYKERLLAQAREGDPVSRRHHYVPKTYLRAWSFDGRRVWALDTVRHTVRPLGLADVCVTENFYRVVGADGQEHNRVESLFGVVDAELRRVQTLFNRLEDPDELEFDDLIALGVTMAMQRQRTAQQRRLRLQQDAWLVAQQPDRFTSIDDPEQPLRVAGIHTELMFTDMWRSADVFTGRQLEIWHDPEGRFTTCDAPVFAPFRRRVRPDLNSTPYIIWPISPHRVIALSNDFTGDKAVIRPATSQMRTLVRTGVEQGRERMIFASAEHRQDLPERRHFRRRTQSRLRCSHRAPDGRPLRPPGCCVEIRETFADRPDVVLCDKPDHLPAPRMYAHT
ncbi:DUF4238 domain-containing protein [Actinokineospora pegani]|uniref:DUF4238 domain-containing protein n=1 Tax=Actinokineospora pegani TaxID=2654637 RepID=UPI0012E99456|nr:DUF4238 domain-containing protein [Actinokineospora pegani]